MAKWGSSPSAQQLISPGQPHSLWWPSLDLQTAWPENFICVKSYLAPVSHFFERSQSCLCWFFNLLDDCDDNSFMITMINEAPTNIKLCYFGHFMVFIFCQKWESYLKQQFWLWHIHYFDNGYGQNRWHVDALAVTKGLFKKSIF